MFGYKENDVVGQHLSCFFTPQDIENGVVAELIHWAEHDGRATGRGWQLRKGGTRFFADGLLTPLGNGRSREFGRQTHDVTERRKEEEALQQTQKLGTIGVLASGIAHDFNNLLGGIMTGVSGLKRTLPRFSRS
jgi:PAS domain S-box-containing protein